MPWWKDFGPTAQEGWCGCMALPRVITLDTKNRLCSKPVDELRILRRNQKELNNFEVSATKVPIPIADLASFELMLEIDRNYCTANKLFILLRASEKKQTLIIFDFDKKKLRFDRNNADDGYSQGIRECDLLLEDMLLEIHIFSDISSIELFTDGGKTCMSNTIYPTHQNQGAYLLAEGGTIRVAKLTTWAMDTIGL
jgi:beta-fructofuranosidase